MRMMHHYALKYPDDTMSEKYLYISTILTESAGNIFETAKWCEDYVNTFPNGKNLHDAMIAAANNYEKSGTTEKAIEFYEMAAKKFPNSEIAQQGAQNAKMLRMGLVTPEQQLQYIQKKQDSLSASK